MYIHARKALIGEKGTLGKCSLLYCLNPCSNLLEINSAGVFKGNSAITADGLDIRFVVNTIKPYLLIQQLTDMEAYAQSKLAITMFILKDQKL
ncbi:MAG: hypothetical protein ACI89T_001212 [Cognaticolwellia sp.]|jgi:hypothetical protein